MRTALARLEASLLGSVPGEIAGPIPLTAGGMPSQELLAPHLVRLPSMPSNLPRSSDA